MNKKQHPFVVLFFITLLSSEFAMAESRSEDDLLVLSKMGVMFVGGRKVEMDAGGRFAGGTSQTQIVDQAPVHYLIPPAGKRKGKSPVIMIPGMGLTSYLYLGTPDSRDGWAQIFAKAGHPVFVFDEPGNAISGFEVSKFTNSEQSPRIMLWSNEITWRRWGIGSEPGVPVPNTRFPVKQIDQLHASMTPVMSGGGGGRGRAGGSRGRRMRGGSTANPKVTALIELLEKTGPATIVMHSASGATGFELTRARGELVNAIVAIEVTGSPTDPTDIKQHFADKRFIGIYGDGFDLRPMQGRYEASVRMTEEINRAGGKAEVIWLPKLGIKGNSHLLMQDNNNDVIAKTIIARLEE